MGNGSMSKSAPVHVPSAKEPLMQLPLVAVLLAIVAGSMDGYTFFSTHSFATFQSGNIILFGYTLAMGEMPKFYAIIISILCFGLGSMATAIIRNEFKKRGMTWTFCILAFEIIVLLLLAIPTINHLFERFHIAWILSFLAGMQGNAFHKVDGQLYGNIAVTLNVQLAFNYLAETFFKINEPFRKAIFNSFVNYMLVLGGFAAGAFLSAAITPVFDSYALVVTALGLIGIWCLVWTIHKQDISAPIDSN